MVSKTLSLVISFNKTTDAMAFEDYCLKNNIEGRLIPLPKEISADCGLAWKCKISQEDEIKKALLATNILYNNMIELLL